MQSEFQSTMTNVGGKTIRRLNNHRPKAFGRWRLYGASTVAVGALLLAGCPLPPPPALTQAQCMQCHNDVAQAGVAEPHYLTQADVAEELAAERAGEIPDDVINGADAENCIACHGPTAVMANGGMSEAEALTYFFTTSGGTFFNGTLPANTTEWENVGCLSCHDAPADHPESKPALALFDSRTAQHVPMSDSSELCGQCHGTLRFPDTDHLTFDAWKISKHSLTQADVAEELAAERAGETPDDVINGADAENCIACHGPTAVMANGGMSEAEALTYFFTAPGGVFDANTASANGDQWPDVACVACHNPHEPSTPAYFNSSTGRYEAVTNNSELCGQCHGSLRFPDTDHLSYDIWSATGGVGVPSTHTMPGATCTSCHMYAADVEDTNSSMFHGHSWAVFVQEDGDTTASCEQCHPGMDASTTITDFQTEFETLYTTTLDNVTAAEQAMDGVTDPTLLTKLEEAQTNLALAEGDESGGFHNHNYLMAVLNDANTKAEEILAAL